MVTRFGAESSIDVRISNGESEYPARSQTSTVFTSTGRAQSVIHGPAPSADNLGNGYVNLVCRNILGGMRPEHTSARDEQDHYWMRIRYQNLVVTWYNKFW